MQRPKHLRAATQWKPSPPEMQCNQLAFVLLDSREILGSSSPPFLSSLPSPARNKGLYFGKGVLSWCLFRGLCRLCSCQAAFLIPRDRTKTARHVDVYAHECCFWLKGEECYAKRDSKEKKKIAISNVKNKAAKRPTVKPRLFEPPLFISARVHFLFTHACRICGRSRLR